MPQDRALSDQELLSVFKDQRADLTLLSREERQRLVSLTEPQAVPEGDQLLENVKNIGRFATKHLPSIGGAVGGLLGAGAGTIFGAGVGAVPGAVGGAALGGATGESAKQLIARLSGGAAPATPLAAGGQIAGQAALQGGAQAGGLAVGAGLRKAGPYLMEKALKPTQTLVDEYRTTAPKIVQTLLDEGINVTQAGLSKLQRIFGETNDAISAAVAGSPAEVSKSAVASYTPQVAAKMAQQVNPTKDLEAVSGAVEEFMQHPVYPGSGKIPVAAAQAMKQGTYQQIGKKYGEVSAAGIETQKALGRGLKEEIAQAVPGVAALNAKDSALMAAQDAVGRRVAMAGRSDPVGFAWVAHNPTTFLAALIDRNPAIKSMLARGAYQSAATAAHVTPQALRIAIEAVASGEDEEGGTSSRPANQ
jgi:hypothetical protein